MQPANLSACWNKLGKLVRQDRAERSWLRTELRHSAALQPLLHSTLDQLPRADARQVSITSQGLAWVVVTAGYAPGEAALDRLAERGARVANKAEVQGLANTVWAFAKMDHQAPALFNGVAAAAVPRVREFNGQDVALSLIHI